MDTCCQGSRNQCAGSCLDQTSSADFLFRLQPGDPQRFLPKPGGHTFYQYVYSDWWPVWGTGDLYMGNTGPPGANGRCNQGFTYVGSTNMACGGQLWGKTDLEAWRLVD